MVVSIGGLTGCSAMDDFEKHQRFVEQEVIGHPKLSEGRLSHNGRELFYMSAGNPDKAIVIWLHGTPGSWSDIGSIMISPNYSADTLWVSVDRMGWGGSEQTSEALDARQLHRRYFARIDQQVSYLVPLLKHLEYKHAGVPIYIAGHSWGGSLAPALALASPNVSGVLIVAGGLSPEVMKVRWYHRLANTWLARLFIGSELQRATEEMLALPSGLSAINDQIMQSPKFKEKPIIILQGGEDSLVPVTNAYYWQEKYSGQEGFENLTVVVDQKFGHLWHMQRPDAIAACVRALIDNKPAVCRQRVEEYDD